MISSKQLQKVNKSREKENMNMKSVKFMSQCTFDIHQVFTLHLQMSTTANVVIRNEQSRMIIIRRRRKERLGWLLTERFQ